MDTGVRVGTGSAVSLGEDCQVVIARVAGGPGVTCREKKNKTKK